MATRSSMKKSLGGGDGSPSEVPESSSHNNNDDSNWLPDGWKVEFKARKSGYNKGKRYKCYVDSQGHKCYSKSQVLAYLEKIRTAPNEELEMHMYKKRQRSENVIVRKAPVAMESAVSSDYDRSVIMTNLPMFLFSKALKRGLVNFREVIKLRFLHRMDYTYTRACILVMESRDAAEEIVEKAKKSPLHFKNNIKAKVEMYSESLHGLLKEKGRRKAWVQLLSKPGEAYQVYEKLEYLLQRCSPTDYRIYKIKGKCTGFVKLRFRTKADRKKAAKIFEMPGSEWEPRA